MTPGSPPNDDSARGAVLAGLGLAVFERRSADTFRLIEPVPPWLSHLWPDLTPGRERPLADLSPFLENFLVDAAVCWATGTEPVRSDAFVEYDRKGIERHLQATALAGSGRALLLIEQLGQEFETTRSVLQKARETLIAYQRLAQPQPPEIAIPLDRFRRQYPDYSKCGFLIMPFTTARPYARILKAIDDTARSHGLSILRADAHEFHGDLLSNVRTYLHGCSFGIAVFERIESDKPNANVGLEVGYLMALNKPVLLLKDRTLPVLQTDLAGRLYRTFDPHDAEGTIPEQLGKWFQDHGIVVRTHE